MSSHIVFIYLYLYIYIYIMVQNGWGMAMDGEEKAGLWRSPWEASSRGGRQGHQKGTMGPLWPGSLLRAGQLDHLDRLGTWVGAQRPRWKQGGQSVWQEGGQVSTHLSTETLALVPRRGEGSQGPAASSGGERCLTRLTMDSTRLEKWTQIPFVLQLPRQNQALQVRKAGDRVPVKDTLSRMALGPGGRAGRPWPRSCPPP